jgi:histidyl-tRNA synthetase
LIGDTELDQGVIQLKDLRGHTQRQVKKDDAAEEVVRELAN